jgi:hypothetical protein
MTISSLVLNFRTNMQHLQLLVKIKLLKYGHLDDYINFILNELIN